MEADQSRVEGVFRHTSDQRTGTQMLTAIIVTVVIVGALGYGLRASRDGLISRRPYNNRYNDAAAAREDYLG
jgi:hypothetical protein